MRSIFASLAVVLTVASCTRSAPPPSSSGVRGDLSYVGGPLVASPSSPRSELGYVSAWAGTARHRRATRARTCVAKERNFFDPPCSCVKR
jgi:hypothetical protein